MLWESDFRKALNKISSRRDADLFLEPVPWKEIGLLDYLDVIKNPMDFQTVKSKFDSEQYGNLDAAVSDVHLIFDNAMLYNLPGSEAHDCAKRLKVNWESLVSQIVVRLEENLNKPAADEDISIWMESCYR